MDRPLADTARAFDRWVEVSPVSTRDLSIYRVIFGVFALTTLPRIGFVSDYPSTFLDPPPGPFALLDTVPAPWVLTSLSTATAVAAVALTIGLWTRCASIAYALLLTSSYGLTYSFGKVDHTILMVVVPLALAFSGWGDHISIDSYFTSRRRRQTPSPWAPRLLAVCIGLALLTAALPKVLTGWLSPSTQASLGHFLTKYVVEDKTGGVAPGVNSTASLTLLWEALDWVTVLLEASVIVAALSWRTFRPTLAVLVVFHLSVLLTMGIAFQTNVIAYAAFIPWARLVTFERTMSSVRLRLVVGAIAAVLLVYGLLMQNVVPVSARQTANAAMVLMGSVFAIAYLVRLAVRSRRHGDELVSDAA